MLEYCKDLLRSRACFSSAAFFHSGSTDFTSTRTKERNRYVKYRFIIYKHKSTKGYAERSKTFNIHQRYSEFFYENKLHVKLVFKDHPGEDQRVVFKGNLIPTVIFFLKNVQVLTCNPKICYSNIFHTCNTFYLITNVTIPKHIHCTKGHST